MTPLSGTTTQSSDQSSGEKESRDKEKEKDKGEKLARDKSATQGQGTRFFCSFWFPTKIQYYHYYNITTYC